MVNAGPSPACPALRRERDIKRDGARGGVRERCGGGGEVEDVLQPLHCRAKVRNK